MKLLVDLEGTLAEDIAGEAIGKPISRMVKRVQAWLSEGHEVRVLADFHKEIDDVMMWLAANGLGDCGIEVGDRSVAEYWSHRAVQTQRNTGEPVKPRSGWDQR